MSRAVIAKTASAASTMVATSQRRFPAVPWELSGMGQTPGVHSCWCVQPRAFVGMADGIVAAGAQDALRIAMRRVASEVTVDRIRYPLVAAAAGGLRHFQVEGRDTDVVGVEAGSEVEGMKEAVAGLDGILAREVVGRMTVVASGGGMMARLNPGVVLGTHGVAIGARRRVVQQVRVALGVDECISAKTEKSAGQDAESD